MKFLFLFINVVSLITTVLGAETLQLTKLCPNECAIVTKCIKLENIQGKKISYSIDPKEGDPLSKCFCTYQATYLACVQCAQQQKNKQLMDAQVLNANCNRLGVQSTEPLDLGTNNGANINNGNTNTNTNANTNTNTNNTNTNNGNSNTLNGTNSSKNSTTTDTGDNKKEGGGKSSSKIGIIVIAVVAAVAVGGFFVYTRKQKERPESMPFFGNSATSPNQYATLSTPKEMTDISTSNLTTDYNTQFYPNVDNNNQYGSGYNNNQYGSGYNQQQDYNNQYDANYSNQYGNYESEIAGVSTAAPVPAVVSSTDPAHYESRRESMMPGSQPTVTNFNGAYVCAYKYDPQLDDELQLQVNDEVQIIEEYEDGWMKAVNLTTGKEGMAPRVCIREV